MYNYVIIIQWLCQVWRKNDTLYTNLIFAFSLILCLKNAVKPFNFLWSWSEHIFWEFSDTLYIVHVHVYVYVQLYMYMYVL